MQSGQVTTPFGRRPVTLALVKSQLETPAEPPRHAVDKWKLFRDVCEARERLGLPDRALTVLNALLSFHPEPTLAGEGVLIVFPSNAQLCVRAHGIAETTLRRHLAALVDAGLIQRHDSPNGKRYAHRARGGAIEAAFGFDLAVLRNRAGEIAELAQAIAADRLALKRMREALTICRRDVRKLITAAIEEGAAGDWATIEAHYIGLVARLPRQPDQEIVESTLDEMTLLREEILNQLEMQLNSSNSDGNHDHFGRHIQNSKPESINELEPCSDQEQGANAADLTPVSAGAEAFNRKEIAETAGETAEDQAAGQAGRAFPAREPRPGPDKPPAMTSFPLGLVLRACPQIVDYGPGGAIGSWRDLMSAAVVVRSMLGVSPSAYEEACAVMGPENAGVMMACILERAGHITSAGGYVRNLTRKTAEGNFSLGPMLMALLKANGGEGRKAG